LAPPTSRRPAKDDDDPFQGLFGDFEEEFRRMQQYLGSMFEEALKNAEIPKGNVRPGNPFVYGFTLRMGPDGKPHFEQFGNTPRTPGLATAEPVEGREPLTDVVEQADHVTVTAELPGVEKEDVQVWVTPDQLTLRVDTPERKYHKVVQLPARVREDSTEATFKNGVLDVSIRKREPGPAKDPGRRVNVK
jgi:HSP20 family protein